MRRARLLGLFICYGRQVGSFDESAGQGNGNRCSQTWPAAGDVDGSTVCLDKGGRDPETEAGSWNGRLMALATEGFTAQLLLFVQPYPHPFIVYRHDAAPASV